jgi:CDP-diacylglycerol pyrophosphatase
VLTRKNALLGADVTRLLAVILLAACAAPQPEISRALDPNGLYRQMQACLVAAEPVPPCTEVDRARGFVVIKDDSPDKPDAWLIVPDHEVTGIEDPRALRPPVVQFWTYGWEVARELLASRPAAETGLAINSKQGRSQNLLHIHISCVLPEVRDALAHAAIGPDWAPEPFVVFRGQTYNARKVASLEPSPFLRLLELPGARERMAEQSLAVIGSAEGGYFLLTDSTESGVVAETEALLDQDCS